MTEERENAKLLYPTCAEVYLDSRDEVKEAETPKEFFAAYEHMLGALEALVHLWRHTPHSKPMPAPLYVKAVKNEEKAVTAMLKRFYRLALDEGMSPVAYREYVLPYAERFSQKQRKLVNKQILAIADRMEDDFAETLDDPVADPKNITAKKSGKAAKNAKGKSARKKRVWPIVLAVVLFFLLVGGLFALLYVIYTEYGFADFPWLERVMSTVSGLVERIVTWIKNLLPF